MRWLPYHSAAANTAVRVWASSWHFVAASKRSSRQEVLTMRPRTRRDREGPCEILQLRYSAAADEGVPSQGIGGRTPCKWLARVHSPHVATIRRCVQVLPEVLIAREVLITRADEVCQALWHDFLAASQSPRTGRRVCRVSGVP